LEILHTFVKTSQSEAVVVAFQDSEAFDTTLLADLIGIFRSVDIHGSVSASLTNQDSSWLDRIPFILLFGIATSVELFHERLSRAASRCLHGVQFDVEQTSSLLERIFQKAVAGAGAPIRLSAAVVSNLIERQQDHVQSVQSFIAALKVSLPRDLR
jgi:origin recognition complex subunit 3